MSEKHTPGSWSVDACGPAKNESYHIARTYEHDGEIHTDEIANVVMDYLGDTSLANARLMAAAPDLLIVARAAGVVIDILATQGHCIPDVQEILQQISDAVRKATEGGDE